MPALTQPGVPKGSQSAPQAPLTPVTAWIALQISVSPFSFPSQNPKLEPVPPRTNLQLPGEQQLATISAKLPILAHWFT